MSSEACGEGETREQNHGSVRTEVEGVSEQMLGRDPQGSLPLRCLKVANINLILTEQINIYGYYKERERECGREGRTRGAGTATRGESPTEGQFESCQLKPVIAPQATEEVSERPELRGRGCAH